MNITYKDSGIEYIGKIPQDWRISKYKFFARSGMGETILSEQLMEKGIPVYSATQDEKNFGYVIQSKVKLKYGDLVIPARGNSIGYVTFIKDEIATCTQTTIYSKLNNICNKFLYYCCIGLKDNWFEFDDTAIPQITVNQVQNNSLPLPSNKEQQQIADYLDKKCCDIDNTIETEKSIIEKLKEYKQSVITQTVTKGLDKSVELKDSGIKWIGKIPKHWKIVRIKNVLLQNKNGIKIGPFGSSLTNRVNDSGKYKIYGQWNIVSSDKLSGENFISEESFNLLKNYEVEQDDILISMMGTVGKAWIVPDNIQKGIMDSHVIKIKINFDKLNSKFFYYQYDKDYSKFIFNQIQYLKKGSIMDGLNSTIVKNLKFILPPLPEQQKIVDYLDKKCSQIDEAIEKKEELIEKLTEYKKSLIYECVTGKRRIDNVQNV